MAKHEAMDIQTVADLLGVSERMVRNYINSNGLPSSGEGRNRVFVWPDVREWYVNYRMDMEMGGSEDGNDGLPSGMSISDSKGDIRSAMLRKTRAEADLKELDLSKRRSEVVTIQDARIRLDRLFGNLRAKLLGLAPKLANRIEGLKTRTQREGVIKEELESLCREISTGGILGLEVEGDTPDVEAIEASAAAPRSNVAILRDFAELLVTYDSLES